MINRIARVFARRGYNIESLAVGLNKDKALFTIVVSGTERVLQQVIEQLQKLVNVWKVEDLSNEPLVERELMLIKVKADPQFRAEVMWLVDIFRAKIVDISESLLTIEVTGDPGKMVAVQTNLRKFGIKEIARTGKIALRREKMGASAPFWRFSAASYPDLHEKVPANGLNGARARSVSNEADVSGGGDVYPVEDGFTINHVLDAHWGFIDDSVQDLTHLPFAERELMLIKIAVNAAARQDVLDIANIFRANAVDVSGHTITLELTGDLDKLVALQRLLEPYGICEVARTGRLALVRESGVDTKYLRGYSLP
ncbi:hypothetical protein E1A91_A10G163400v1 [Gossypium mustelinum]|uniref:ACT domain-containing protein n=1 Tax=Gossypium mustelinum TaxID=34275 RepID=A0A5D2XQ95_GOSMU|nr:hypothetical protein E1A91_A10G163400v1 [Gossypium mustelinum]